MPRRHQRGPGVTPSRPLAADGPPAPSPTYDTVLLDTPQSAEEHARGSEFIRLFNELDHHIKRLTSSIGGEGFFRRLQWAARDQPQIKRYIDDLMEFSELRNALVHDRRYPNKLIAVPTEETLVDFRRLVELVVRPRHVIPAFASTLRVFDTAEPLSAALAYMHEGGYTQVAVRAAGQLRLLTAAGITRWLASLSSSGGRQTAPSDSETGEGAAAPRESQTDPSSFQAANARTGGLATAATGNQIDLAAATIADVLAFEKPEALALIPAGATIEDAVDLFQRSVAKHHIRLFAVLITEHGRPEEEPLGIITPADLLDEE